MHWCAVALDYLISTRRYNKITFTLLACRYWSWKPYLIADTFKDPIYLKQSLLFIQLGRELGGGVGGGDHDSHQYLFIWNLMLTDGQKIYAYYSHMNQKSLQECPILTSHPLPISGKFSVHALHWCHRAGVSLKLSNELFWNVLTWMSPGLGHFCWPAKKRGGGRPCKQLWTFKGNYLRDPFIFYFASFYTPFLTRS